MSNLLERIFKRKKPVLAHERSSVISNRASYFTRFSGNAYENDIYRAAVDSIARNAAKLKGTHVITSTDNRREGDNYLNRILQVNPNPYMTAYDMIYKLVTHYYLHNNAFAFLQKDERGYLQGIYPLSPQNIEYVTDEAGEMYCKFLFNNGKEITLHHSEVFAVKRFYNSDELLGDSNNAIFPTLEVAHAQSEGMKNSIESGATIRGIIKTNNLVNEEKLRFIKETITAQYFGTSNQNGLLPIDSSFDYIPLNNTTVVIDENQIKGIKTKIYEYLGISENIVNSTYSEDEWAAFYESVLEPLAIQFSLELTRKVFTPREQAFGNSIIFEANRLQFASNETKTNIIKELMPLGLLTVNQALDILNLPPVEDGDKRIQTLNVVNAEKADEYQLDDNAK